MNEALTTVAIDNENDIVIARQRARQVAGLLGLDVQDQARVATAVSELARNAFEYARGGRVRYEVSSYPDAELVVTVSDRGPGIPNLDEILAGRYQSKTGMGIGVVGARRLMDRFEVVSERGSGTTVTVAKRLTEPAPAPAATASIAATLARENVDPQQELQLQNRELMRALDELTDRRNELARLNRELEETNRGVVALYAELDERAEELRRSSEAKSGFLSSVTHELRTPLSSMLALCDLLLERSDGPLTDEQERQINYIRRGVETLLPLVNDLLDLARIEAGKTVVRADTFEIEDLFASLRGMFRPLHRDEGVALVFEPAEDMPAIRSDESKIAQVLRNLVSNALKFTRDGEVRIRARRQPGDGSVSFVVRDTGIGIAPENQLRIFQEFEQVEGPLQSQTRGTGLGLAVAQRLAAVLGGSISLESEPGQGSTFVLTIPVSYDGPDSSQISPGASGSSAPSGAQSSAGRAAVVIDDDEMARYLAVHALLSLGFRVVEASAGADGLRAIQEHAPDLVVVDLKMPGVDGFEVLDQLGQDRRMASIPVVVQTGMALSEADRGRLAHAVAVVDKRSEGTDELTAVVRTVMADRAPIVSG